MSRDLTKWLPLPSRDLWPGYEISEIVRVTCPCLLFNDHDVFFESNLETSSINAGITLRLSESEGPEVTSASMEWPAIFKVYTDYHKFQAQI